VRHTHPDEAAAAWTSRDKPTSLPIDRAEGRFGKRRFCHLGAETIDEAALWDEPVVESVPLWRSDGHVELGARLDYPAHKDAWHDFVMAEARRDVADGTSAKVQVTAISESGGKIRIVTSGSQAGATVSTVWQQRILAVLKTLPFFPSMSKVITADLINRVMGRVRDLAASSDFTAATDLLCPRLTNWILRQLVEGFEGADIVMDDNADKELDYGRTPRQYKLMPKDGIEIRGKFFQLAPVTLVEGQPMQQGMAVKWRDEIIYLTTEKLKAWKRCGQLMGQVTSFPLLCLANLACTLAAYKLHGIGYEEAKDRFIINGDDRLARSSIAIEDTFWTISSSIGLKRSPGKSHEDRDFACINSQMYWRDGRGLWQRASVLRSTLLHGIMKLSTDVFKPSHVVSALFDHVPAKCMERAIGFYLMRWGKTIEEECAGRNLFLPVALNGLGQVPPPGWKWFISDRQAMVAAHLMRTQPFASWAAGPQWPGPSREEPATSQPWDQPVAALSAGSLEEELAQFQAREGYRVSQAIFRHRRVAWCCGEERTSDCPCGKVLADCPAAAPCIRKVARQCDCISPAERAWERLPDAACHVKETTSWRDDCCHPKWRIEAVWHCDCHGESMPWRRSTRPEPPLVFSMDEIKSAVRPTTVYFRQHHESAGRRHKPSVLTWRSVDHAGFIRPDPARLPAADLDRQHAQMMTEIEIAIARATGDWRRLV